MIRDDGDTSVWPETQLFDSEDAAILYALIKRSEAIKALTEYQASIDLERERERTLAEYAAKKQAKRERERESERERGEREYICEQTKTQKPRKYIRTDLFGTNAERERGEREYICGKTNTKKPERERRNESACLQS